MEPNQDQILHLVRTTIGFISGWAVAKGYGDANFWVMISGVAGVIVPYVWGLYANSNAAKLNSIAAMPAGAKNAAFNQISDSVKLASVEAMPDVKRIVVSSAAKDGVADAAADNSRPKVTTG